VIEIIFSIPFIYGRIPPNKVFGFRIRETYNNGDLWYKVNRYCGRDLLVAGFLILFMGVIFLFLEVESIVGFIVGFWFAVIPLIVVSIRSYLFLRRESK
ncbi:MAG TPA: SdpI family protein, partial [Thermoplasmatales archaeon]|nr:SdpI family protein [Thermoplasmatales archaeon]